jgi:hypothetical protein
MTSPLDRMAKRVEGDPFFLAPLLALFARSEGLDDAGLAAAFGRPVEILTDLRLCRAPRLDADGFRQDIAAIAGRFGLDAGVLATVVRRGQVLQAVTVSQQERSTADVGGGSFLAARDAPPEPGDEP